MSFTDLYWFHFIIISKRGTTDLEEEKTETDLTEIVKFDSSSLGNNDKNYWLSSDISRYKEEALILMTWSSPEKFFVHSEETLPLYSDELDNFKYICIVRNKEHNISHSGPIFHVICLLSLNSNGVVEDSWEFCREGPVIHPSPGPHLA